MRYYKLQDNSGEDLVFIESKKGLNDDQVRKEAVRQCMVDDVGAAEAEVYEIDEEEYEYNAE